MGDKYFEKDVNSPDYARDTLEFYLEKGRPVCLSVLVRGNMVAVAMKIDSED
jgi:hypothetical protein